MKQINLQGITTETVCNVFLLLIALINAVLQMLGVRTLPLENEEVSNIISTVFLIITALWNTWKNRNITTISQEMQQITDAVRHGEILEQDIQEWIAKVNKQKKGLDI